MVSFRLVSLVTVLSVTVFAISGCDVEADEAEDLAKQLSNPIASLISIPVEFDYDTDIGPIDAGSRQTITVKPVVPFSLNENWNLITRTIIPLVDQEDIFPGAGDQSGLGDIFPSVWFSPVQPSSKGIIWGVGPAMLLPTASDDLLGAEKWGLGPTIVGLKQNGPLTIGFLGNHIWDFAGEDNRADINSTFLQPFINYTTANAVTFALNTESTYDWDSEDWTVPINLVVSKLTRIGRTPVQFKGGIRYWADTTEFSPEGWGFKLAIVILKPK